MSDVIVGFDGSACSIKALHWAAEEARHRQVPVRVLQSWREPVMTDVTGAGMWFNPDDLRREVAESLEAKVAAVMADHPGVGSSCRLLDDAPAHGLIEAAPDAGLVVVGSRGRGGFLGLELGSVSSRVARRAESPIVVVRGDEDHQDRRDLVVGVDGTAGGRNALAWAIEEAHRRDKRIVAVMAWNHLEPMGFHGPEAGRAEYGAADAAKVLSTIVSDVMKDLPSVDWVERSPLELPAKALLDTTEQAFLIVVGRHGSSKWAPPDIGTTSQQVLHHAACPVAIIPGPA